MIAINGNKWFNLIASIIGACVFRGNVTLRALLFSD